MIIGSMHGIRRTNNVGPGLCSKISDPDVFLSNDIEDIKQAKLMCAVCPIRKSCLTNAMQSLGHMGVQGGLTWCERRAVKQGRHGFVEPKDCAQCSRPFMPRGNARFCEQACHAQWKNAAKKVRRISQSSPATAKPDVRLDLLAKTG